MTVKSPLVLGSDGLPQQLQTGDSIAITSGITSGNAVLDFGVIGGVGSNEANIAVTGQTGILTTSSITVTVLADSTTTNHSANDHVYFLSLASILVNTPTVGVGFTIYARSVHKLSGQFKINWQWS